MKNNILKASIVILASTISILTINAQNVTLKLNETKHLDQKADSAVIRDINGEICSMAIVYGIIPGIKFYSNLSIEKIRNDSTHYTIWFPMNTSMLKIVVPGYPLLEHTIERKSAPTVYIFLLEIPEQHLIKTYSADSILKRITITTVPENAKVYQSTSPEVIKRNRKYEILIGRTPLTMDYLSSYQRDVINIYKSGYVTYQLRWDSISPGMGYHYNFRKISHQKQWFLSATIGSLEFPRAFIFGLQAGMLGKYGFYFSGNMASLTKVTSGHSFAAGFIKSFTRAAHLNLGLGYSYYNINEKATTVYDDIEAMILDIGFIFRFGTQRNTLFLIKTSFCPSIASEFIESSVGVGFAF